jgi:pimeloyl-ACP methyl ester carboxylesterase
LVHGTWHGGWCWSKTADRLRKLGHAVHTPTLTGVGERRHLLSPDITLQTFVQDIANVLIWENLHDVILVGHSFGGVVISGVADLMPERLSQLIYLDAFILESGVSTFDTLPEETVAKLRAAARALPIPAVPAPKPSNLGLQEPGDIAFVQERLTPQPLGTYESALRLNHPMGNGLPCTYLHCTAPSFPVVEGARQWVKKNTDWAWAELSAGHDAMVSAPDLVAARLDALAANPPAAGPGNMPREP